MTRLLFILLTSYGLIGCGQRAASPTSETAPSAAPSAPQVSTSGYIKYWPGTLPIVISVPHDGAVMPPDIPDRTEGVTVRDTYSRALAEAIRAALTKKFGRAPHLIVCEISRKKVDCNRELAKRPRANPARALPRHPLACAPEQANRNRLPPENRGPEVDRPRTGYR